MPAAIPFPPGTRLRADPSLRLRDQGRILIGGSPLRFIRLTDAGRQVFKSWLTGQPPAPTPGATKLARRLVDAGMVHPEPAGEVDGPPITVVIPVKDDQGGLDLTVGLLPTVPIVVVDDGSEQPVRASERAQHPIMVRRRETAGGPGIARQEAMDVIDTPLVAFVDAGVEVTEEQLAHLARWFTDPTIMAVAPRVAATPRTDQVARYEVDHSPLDLGQTPSAVGHGRIISYLPTACLVARRDAVKEVGGFDPALRFGEDVDLVWRLLADGRVRYDPTIVTNHPARTTLAGLARQRYGYGLAAAPLADRHGSALAPVRISPWSLAVWLLALAGRPLAATGLAAYTATALAKKLATRVPDHKVECVQLAARGHLYAGLSIAEASVRIWWPLTVVAYLAGIRRPVLLLVSVAWLRRIRSIRGGPVDRARSWAFGLVDDFSYGAGAWVGAIRHRSGRCLAPRLVDWPGKEPT